MRISVDIVETLLNQSVKKAGKTSDRFGLIEAVSVINEALSIEYKQIGNRYLYDTLFLGVQRTRNQQAQTINLDRAMLDSLAAFLGFHSLDEFQQAQEPLVPLQVRAIEGNWYSIVRCNSGKARVLISPVVIEVINSVTFFELRGPHRTYRGKINWIGGSFSSFLVSKDGAKVIHLAFRLGVAKKPKILNGVFSGVSSSGIPIAGKELLVRSEEEYTAMKNKKVNIGKDASLSNNESLLTPEIIQYFANYDSSYIKIDFASTFDKDDLL